MPVLLFTSENIASKNIAKKLIEKYKFQEKTKNEWEYDDIRLIETNAPSIIDIPTDFETDYLLVLSSHKSKNGGKMLTAHFPGNWGEAIMGGEPNTLNIACASRLKILINELVKANEKLKWPVFIEADHHGPTCNIPIIFVEIGSTEQEWEDVKAIEVVADAVFNSLKKQESFETVFCVGGGHYSREFTKLVLETDLAVGHIAPKYAIDSLDKETIKQAIEKNVEKVSKIVIAKDGTNRKQKDKVIEFAKELGLEYELI